MRELFTSSTCVLIALSDRSMYHNRDIIRHNIIVDISGNGHGMGIDMNIEHIIGWLKVRTS